MPWLDVRGRRRIPDIRQSTTSECGLACLAMIARWHGAATDLVALRRQHRTTLRGQSLTTLVGISHRMGMRARAIRCSVDDLANLRTPCVLHWNFDHFVVLASVGKSGVVLNDPARGRTQMSFDEVDKAFTGVALEVLPGPGFEPGSPPDLLKLSNLLSRETWTGRGLLAAVLLALICESLVLLSPFYLQTIIDDVVVSGDIALLDTLALAFLALLAFQVAATVMRALTFQILGFISIFDMAARVLDKLLSLPVPWFRSRDLGDIQHRFQALARVQAFIVESAPKMLVDTIFFILLITLLIIYEPLLTFLNIAAVLLIAAWRAVVFPYRLRAAADVAVAESTMQSHFLESLRAIVSIKHANGSPQRSAEWCNRLGDTINARIRAGNLQIIDAGVRQSVFNLARILSIYLLAKSVLAEQFTIGMLAAYAAYLGMLFARTSAIIDAIFEYRLLRVPLGRLGEIVFSEAEARESGGVTPGSGRVEIRDVSFSYGANDAPVIRNCEATIETGRFIAIAGSSGSGKSTLLQLIAGSELPSSGQLLHDNLATTQCAPAVIREHVACVLHDDCLLKGSIADNIALFDHEPSFNAVRRAAELAQIHEDIITLPMRYQTRIGDLGTSLSKGQVQRVLLARAYYRKPAVLLLDEATSGLDGETERRVVAALREQPATRIVVTHSDQMLEAADEVWWLRNGSLVSSPPAINA